FENGLACADLDRPVAPRKPDLETTFDGRRFPGLEIFNMHMAGGTIRRRSLECFEHRQRAAAIEVSPRGRGSNVCWKIEHAPGPLIVKVEMHLRGPVRSKRIKLVEKCRGALRPGGIDKLPGAPQSLKTANHRQQGRNSDPAGNQDRVLGSLAKRKIVARMGH